ncbi:MAG: phosphoenolpyruvate--protein phosphotransferase [Promicromonosporaceae bacterium]|nr:phosphoenolpyruvate--protein phosphotransferase [Promicromonosporaceae bacterium]
MTTFSGVGIGRGIAQGPVARMAPPAPPPSRLAAHLAPAEELELALTALTGVSADLIARAERTDGTAQAVLLAQAEMAEDPEVRSLIEQLTDQGCNAAWAVYAAFSHFGDSMIAAGGFHAERAADLKDVAARAVAHIEGQPTPGAPDPGHPYVLVARDLAPADTALLDLSQVLAIVTEEGGPTSHTAILAREMGIVAVLGVGDFGLTPASAADPFDAGGTPAVRDGQVVIVDAAAGTVVVDPTAEALAAAAAQQEALAEEEKAGGGSRNWGRLADGTRIPLLANLGSSAGADEARALGAEGVGLFRTEFLFLDAAVAPSIDTQWQEYTRLLSVFSGRKVVARVLDAGADKPLAFMNPDDEPNPALGLRGIRALRAHEDVLRTQLQALSEAADATSADLWVMAPMVTDAAEAAYFKAICTEYGLPRAGVMIEIPAAALLAESVLAECDFVSVGTNDLAQYTLAADRLLGTKAYLQDPWHPAVLRLIALAGAAGLRVGKDVGVCGEAAADPRLAVVLVGLGATSLSMAPPALQDVRAELSKYSREQAKAAADAALAASSAVAARAAACAVLTASSAAVGAVPAR